MLLRICVASAVALASAAAEAQPATTWPSGRGGHTLVFDNARGETLLLGGESDNAAQRGDTLWIRWHRLVVSGPGTRMRHRMAYDATRGVTVLFGGDSSSDTWLWDGRTWTRAATEGPSPRMMSALAFDSRRGRIVLYGGQRDATDSLIELDHLWEWDGARWHRMGPQPAAPIRR